MLSVIRNATFFIIVTVTLISGALAIECYVCSSDEHPHCTETLDLNTTVLQPESCDHVYEANYCVKTTGMFKGEVGTTRFCSSVDMGNICDFEQRRGGVREYRTCIYSCSDDGCNGSPLLSASVITTSAFVLLLLRWI